jgi:hypothetical protein
MGGTTRSTWCTGRSPRRTPEAVLSPEPSVRAHPGSQHLAEQVYGGSDSAFWHVLHKHRVDPPLCAGLHDITAHHDPVSRATPLQIGRGSNSLSARTVNYLIVQKFPIRIELELSLRVLSSRVTSA